MKVSDELNQFSASLFERAATADDEKKMKSLKDKVQIECKHYQRMPGEEMRKRQKLCK